MTLLRSPWPLRNSWASSCIPNRCLSMGFMASTPAPSGLSPPLLNLLLAWTSWTYTFSLLCSAMVILGRCRPGCMISAEVQPSGAYASGGFLMSSPCLAAAVSMGCLAAGLYTCPEPSLVSKASYVRWLASWWTWCVRAMT